jgi:hypothetical protein
VLVPVAVLGPGNKEATRMAESRVRSIHSDTPFSIKMDGIDDGVQTLGCGRKPPLVWRLGNKRYGTDTRHTITPAPDRVPPLHDLGCDPLDL